MQLCLVPEQALMSMICRLVLAAVPHSPGPARFASGGVCIFFLCVYPFEPLLRALTPPHTPLIPCCSQACSADWKTSQTTPRLRELPRGFQAD